DLYDVEMRQFLVKKPLVKQVGHCLEKREIPSELVLLIVPQMDAAAHGGVGPKRFRDPRLRLLLAEICRENGVIDLRNQMEIVHQRIVEAVELIFDLFRNAAQVEILLLGGRRRGRQYSARNQQNDLA